MSEESIQSKGGHARAKSMTPDQRSEAAKKAAVGRWQKEYPRQTTWFFRDGDNHIRLETPEDMPMDLWEKLNAYVQILKPHE